MLSMPHSSSEKPRLAPEAPRSCDLKRRLPFALLIRSYRVCAKLLPAVPRLLADPTSEQLVLQATAVPTGDSSQQSTAHAWCGQKHLSLWPLIIRGGVKGC